MIEVRIIISLGLGFFDCLKNFVLVSDFDIYIGLMQLNGIHCHFSY